MGKFYLEAQTREKLKQDEKTADAYFRAARQKEFNAPNEEAEIARLYSRAAHLFAESGLEQQYQTCFQKVVFYDYLPQIVVSIQVEQVFRVNEFNTMHLLIKNIGRGLAHDVRIGVGSNRFETQATAGLFLIKRLAPEAEKEGILYVQPLDGQVGEAVPLQVQWNWQSSDGQIFKEELSTPVKVLGKDDSKVSGPPIIINAEHYTHVEGTYAARDVISGDQIHGDVLKDHAQKGDKVEINRGQGHSQVTLQPDTPAPPQRPCPICQSPVEMDAKFCNACGQKI
jgi:hypothetical protein